MIEQRGTTSNCVTNGIRLRAIIPTPTFTTIQSPDNLLTSASPLGRMFEDFKEVSVRSDLQVHSPIVVVQCYIMIPNRRQSDQTIWFTVLSVKSCKLSSGHSIFYECLLPEFPLSTPNSYRQRFIDDPYHRQFFHFITTIRCSHFITPVQRSFDFVRQNKMSPYCIF